MSDDCLIAKPASTRRPNPAAGWARLGALLLTGAIAVGITSSCATNNTDQARRWGCVTGTFLKVAADNFGGKYLDDVATISRLFTKSDGGGSDSSSRPGCSIVSEESPVGDWVKVAADKIGGKYSDDAMKIASLITKSDGGGSDPEEYAVAEEAMVDPMASDWQASGSEHVDSGGSYPEEHAVAEEAMVDPMASDWQASGSEYVDSGGSYPEEYAAPSDSSGATTQGALALDVTLVGQIARDGARVLAPMSDGEVLRHGAEDTFQIYLRPTADAYIYVYAVDATAWIQRLHPDAERGHQNPVSAGREVLLPRSDYFFGLDEFTGSQEIWFLVSRTPRPDIDALLSAYPLSRERPMPEVLTRSGDPLYARIEHPSVFARGLVEVGAADPMQMSNSEGESFDVTPTRLFTNPSDVDLSFSRWFQHQ